MPGYPAHGVSLGMLGFLAIPAMMLAMWVTKQEHDEAALLSDWSSPPPWLVFTALTFVAGALQSAADALTPPPVRAVNMAFGFQNTQLMHLCQELRIPDVLASGPKTPAQIAAATNTTDAQRIERLMFALAANGLTRLKGTAGEEGAPQFVNTPLSAVFRSDHPNSMSSLMGSLAQNFYPVGGHLSGLFGPKASTSAAHAWDSAHPEFPMAQGGLWALFEAKPEREEQFGRGMGVMDSLGAGAQIADGPWAKFARFIDVGGSRGHFLHRLLKAFPDKEGVLFDRPPVIENAKRAWAAGEFEAGPEMIESRRVSFARGSFFEPETLPKARQGDAVCLRWILHDWPVEQVLSILRAVRASMDAGATLLIGEAAVPDRDRVGKMSAMYHMDLLMMYSHGAMERTPAQWKEVLEQTGFRMVALHPTRSILHWVEASPV